MCAETALLANDFYERILRYSGQLNFQRKTKMNGLYVSPSLRTDQRRVNSLLEIGIYRLKQKFIDLMIKKIESKHYANPTSLKSQTLYMFHQL